MSKRLVIIGAGGHGKVVADTAVKSGYAEICFVDDRVTGTCMGYPIVGTSTEISRLNDGRTEFIIATGDNAVRRKFAEEQEIPWATLIHPSAQIGAEVRIKPGTVVTAGAIVNAAAQIGAHCIINSGAVVEHDNVLGDYVHISPRAALGGTVTVGDETHIGIGAIVKNNIEICDKCMIGAGAVVVKKINEPGKYIGNPARKMRKYNEDMI